jgi:hypothetical protein
VKYDPLPYIGFEEGSILVESYKCYSVFYNENDEEELEECLEYIPKIVDTFLIYKGYENTITKENIAAESETQLYNILCSQKHIPCTYSYRNLIKSVISNREYREVRYRNENRLNAKDYYFARYREILYKNPFDAQEASLLLQRLHKDFLDRFTKDCKIRFNKDRSKVNLHVKMMKKILNDQSLNREKGLGDKSIKRIASICRVAIRKYIKQVNQKKGIEWLSGLYEKTPLHSPEEFKLYHRNGREM